MSDKVLVINDDNGIALKRKSLPEIDGYGQPTDEQVAEALAEWLNDHPEATTTVENGSLTAAKFTDTLKAQSIKDYVTPQMYGALGNGVDDDSDAFEAALDAAREANLPLYIPEGSYIYLNKPDGYSITASRIMIFDGKVSLYPAGNTPDGSKTLVFRYNSNIPHYKLSLFDADYIRIIGCKNTYVQLGRITSLTLYADGSDSTGGSMGYNMFEMSYVETLHLYGANHGWINENYFHNGRIKHLVIEGDYNHNGNVFDHNTFEDSVGSYDFTADISCGHSNYFLNERFEINSPTSYFKFEGTARYNYIQSIYDVGLVDTYILPVWFVDTYGKNFYYTGMNPPIRTDKLVIDANSRNYKVNTNTSSGALSCYPTVSPANKLHVTTASDILETDFIPIDRLIQFVCMTDDNVLVVFTSLYNASKEQITTEPSNSIFISGGSTKRWDSTNHFYTSRATNANPLDRITYRICRYAEGSDSEVRYVKFRIVTRATGDISSILVMISRALYVNFNPFTDNGKLIGIKIPASNSNAAWKYNTFVENVNSGIANTAGWVYNGSAWKAVIMPE